MPLPNPWTLELEPATVLTLGIRAAWLHLHLVDPRIDALAPRDRELLTLVATRPHGIPQRTLVDLQRRLGVQPAAAERWIDRLIAQGWLERRHADPGPVIDLPAPDLDWIGHQVDRLSAGAAR
jgi:hypothetical protein